MTTGKNWKDQLVDDMKALNEMEKAQAAAIESGVDSVDLSGIPGVQVTNSTRVNEDTNTAGTPTGGVADLKSMISQSKVEEKPSGEEPSATANEELLKQLNEMKAELQRFKSEDGRARVLSEQAKQLRSENEQLKEQLRQAQGKARPLSGPLDEFTESESEVLTDEMKEIMASRFYRVSQDAEEMRSKLSKLEEEYNESKRIRHEADMDSMNRVVANKFPDLEQIAKSDAWANYCSELDPVTGTTHGELFQNAVESCNSNAVIALISRFKLAAGVPSNTQQVGFRPEETSSPNSYKAKSGNGPAVYRIGEVTKFMNAVMSGRINPNVPEHAARYKAYREALSDGRVTE